MDQKDKVLIFRCSEKVFALPLKAVQEILLMSELSKPPGLPSFIFGFLNLEGTAVPVLRLHYFLGLREMTPGLYTPLICTHVTGRLVAFMVDQTDQITDKPEPKNGLISIDETNVFNGCAAAQFSRNGDPIHLLSLERIILKEEHDRMDELKQMEQERLAAI